MSETGVTRSLATNKPQSRAQSSGRFQRVKTARWRDSIGAPVRMGRPPSVTAELAEVGKRMLREGATVEHVCRHLGVDRRSWYRYVHRDGAEVRAYKATKRRANSISSSLERQMVALDKKGLPRVAIAERLGLHINTVVKYLLRAGRPRRR